MLLALSLGFPHAILSLTICTARLPVHRAQLGLRCLPGVFFEYTCMYRQLHCFSSKNVMSEFFFFLPLARRRTPQAIPVPPAPHLCSLLDSQPNKKNEVSIGTRKATDLRGWSRWGKNNNSDMEFIDEKQVGVADNYTPKSLFAVCSLRSPNRVPSSGGAVSHGRPDLMCHPCLTRLTWEV